MASGNTLLPLVPQHFVGTISNPAGYDERVTSTVRKPVLDFDAATDEGATVSAMLPRHYAGGGMTVRIAWTSTSATSGNVVWEGAWQRHQSAVDNVTTDSFATAKTVTAAAPGTAGIIVYSEIAFTNSEIDGLLVAEYFTLRLRRLGSNGSDTMTGDAELLGVEIRET